MYQDEWTGRGSDGALCGFWMPDCDDWRLMWVKGDGNVDGVAWSKSNPGPVIEVEVELDGLGTASGSGRVVFSEYPGQLPLTRSLRLQVHSPSLGWLTHSEWVYVAPDDRNPDNPQGWDLELRGLDSIVADDVTDGSVPPNFQKWGVAVGGVNRLGRVGQDIRPNSATERVGDFMRRVMLAAGPNASWGVDGNRQAVVGTPESGTPILLWTALGEVQGVSPSRPEELDYGDQWIVDPGPGWRKFRSDLREREPFARVKTVDGPPATFEEVTLPTGPALLEATLLDLGGTATEAEGGAITGMGARAEPQPIKWDRVPGADDPRRAAIRAARAALDAQHAAGTISDQAYENGKKDLDDDLDALLYDTEPLEIALPGRGYFAYLVWDFSSWFAGSALPETNESDYEPLTASMPLGVKAVAIPAAPSGAQASGSYNGPPTPPSNNPGFEGGGGQTPFALSHTLVDQPPVS